MGKESFGMRWIRRRLGGYKQLIHQAEAGRPTRLTTPRSVAVIGGGIAGISAAAHLAERGFSVALFEKDSFLGGKVGSWPVRLGEEEFLVEHGFHAFFRQYHNLRAFLERIGSAKHLKPIDDYLILTEKHGEFSFKGVHTTPIYNLLSMARQGIYSLRKMIFNPKSKKMNALFQYEPESTFARYDHIPFSQFAQEAGLDQALIRVFTSFARAFFAEPDQMSMAEMMKGFHFYFLSNDGGLLYDYLDDDFEYTLLAPIRAFFEEHGVSYHLQAPIDRIERQGKGFVVRDQYFDAVVMASDVVGTRRIAAASSFLQEEAPTFAKQLDRLQASERYAVLRLWLDRDIREGLPVFLFTDRIKLLDSISLYHRMEKASIQWAKEHGGSVIELHSYAVPPAIVEREAVRESLLKEFESFFPEIKGASIRHEYLQLRQDFSAFHTGCYADRPTFHTPIDGFFLAGDWVRLPCPAMLMEAAHTSGMFAANAILDANGLQTNPIYSVPLRGLFAPHRKAGLRQLPAPQA